MACWRFQNSAPTLSSPSTSGRSLPKWRRTWRTGGRSLLNMEDLRRSLMDFRAMAKTSLAGGRTSGSRRRRRSPTPPSSCGRRRARLATKDSITTGSARNSGRRSRSRGRQRQSPVQLGTNVPSGSHHPGNRRGCCLGVLYKRHPSGRLNHGFYHIFSTITVLRTGSGWDSNSGGFC